MLAGMRKVRFSLKADFPFPPAFCLELLPAVFLSAFHTIRQPGSDIGIFRILEAEERLRSFA